MRALSLLVLACLLALLAPAAPVVSASPADPRPPVEPRPEPQPEPQTSDGVAGAVVAPLPPSLRGRRAVTNRATWEVAPGIRARVWDERTPRGPVRAYLLTVAWRTKGLSFTYLNDGTVRRTTRVGAMVQDARAVAGVNGDFFDIGRTSAPLGIGVHPRRGLFNGRSDGWNSAFFLTRTGRPRIGNLVVRTTIRQRPGLVVSTVNSPRVKPQGIGVYTERWGRAAGNAVTDGPQKRRRMVLVREGRVVRNSTTLLAGSPVRGLMLVGRGDGADQLADFAVGDRLTLRREVLRDPLMAITGSEQILDDRRVLARDDRILHPRTAVGVDLDGRRVLLLVVDGRQEFSRGYTLVELAARLRSLGAEDALNLDGGGSSTMVAREQDGELGLVNSPSDGRPRQVANALGVRYVRPR